MRRPEPRLISANTVVEPEQVGGDPSSDDLALPRHDRALILEISKERGNDIGLLGPLGCEAVALRMELPDGREGSLDSLHDLEFDVLELGLTARERVKLVLEVRELLGVVHRT